MINFVADAVALTHISGITLYLVDLYCLGDDMRKSFLAVFLILAGPLPISLPLLAKLSLR